MYIAPEGKHVYGLLINEPLPLRFSRSLVFPSSRFHAAASRRRRLIPP